MTDVDLTDIISRYGDPLDSAVRLACTHNGSDTDDTSTVCRSTAANFIYANRTDLLSVAYFHAMYGEPHGRPTLTEDAVREAYIDNTNRIADRIMKFFVDKERILEDLTDTVFNQSTYHRQLHTERDLLANSLEYGPNWNPMDGNSNMYRFKTENELKHVEEEIIYIGNRLVDSRRLLHDAMRIYEYADHRHPLSIKFIMDTIDECTEGWYM